MKTALIWLSSTSLIRRWSVISGLSDCESRAQLTQLAEPSSLMNNKQEHVPYAICKADSEVRFDCKDSKESKELLIGRHLGITAAVMLVIPLAISESFQRFSI